MSITSGAGFNLAGLDGGAGIDLVAKTVPAALPPLPAAINYDAYNRCLTENADGTFMQVHPVDQAVQLLLTVPQGTCGAIPGVGARYAARLRGIPAAQQQSIALDETRVALAALIKAGDVTLLSVSVVVPNPGSSMVSVSYVNNRLPSSTPTTANVMLTTG